MSHIFCLEKPRAEDAKEFVEMMELWHYTRSHINPKLLRFFRGDYARWMEIVDRHRTGSVRGNELPQGLYFLKCDGVLVGAVSLRDRIRSNEVRGHISYGIHPSYRRRGYGKMALKLALKKTKDDYGISSVQIICNSDNQGSKKIMESCGGVFVRHTYKNEILTDVYHFDIDRILSFGRENQ